MSNDVEILTAAYERVLALVKLKDRDDALTELITIKLIEVYRTGERDPAHLCATALKELGVLSRTEVFMQGNRPAKLADGVKSHNFQAQIRLQAWVEWHSSRAIIVGKLQWRNVQRF